MNLVVNTIAIMDRKDLLAGVNPAISFLIKTLLSRPAYIGLEAECHLTHGDHTIHGYGMMEYMLFRSKSFLVYTGNRYK